MKMIKMATIKLPLTKEERNHLRKNKIKIADITDFAPDELEVILNVSPDRAKELYALADFQSIPSVGIKFAEDLVFLGYYSIDELKGKDGAELTNAYERKKGYWTDPCVEDQFRLVVHFAHYRDYSKRWWSFTEERKRYRSENGYPGNRPSTCWFDLPENDR